MKRQCPHCSNHISPWSTMFSALRVNNVSVYKCHVCGKTFGLNVTARRITVALTIVAWGALASLVIGRNSINYGSYWPLAIISAGIVSHIIVRTSDPAKALKATRTYRETVTVVIVVVLVTTMSFIVAGQYGLF